MCFHSHDSVPHYVFWNSLQKEEVNPVKSGKELCTTIKYVQNISNRVVVKGQNEKGRKEENKQTKKKDRKRNVHLKSEILLCSIYF